MVQLKDKSKMTGYTITVPNDLYGKIKRIADREGRSFNKQVGQALLEMVESREAARKAAKASAAA